MNSHACRAVARLFLGSAILVFASVDSMQAQTPNPDAVRVAKAIQASYYHPDSLPGLECNVTFDWPAFFTAMKMELPPERLKDISAGKIHVRAMRGKAAQVTVDWSAAKAPNEQLTSGITQMISGFYQAYWPLIASSPISSATDINKVEPQRDGTIQVTSGNANASVVLLLDKQMIPSSFKVEMPGMKSDVTMHYADTLNPTPGDARRVTGMDMVEHIGSSTMNVKLLLDYQPVESYFVPRKVSFDVVGAYFIVMEYSGCSVLTSAPTPSGGPHP